MGLARILVDGYSLLHAWPELAPGRARHSMAARDELIRVLTLYGDASGTPVTVVFDGAGTDRRPVSEGSTRTLEILYSRAGQTADEIIERAAHRLQAYGEVMAVTDDFTERDTVISVGGMVSSCASFIRTINSALEEQADEIKVRNRRERSRFRRPAGR